ncbi:hypothetical protein [Streptomyces sp. NBC_01565]|uniref:hypothetical protein n=1 Tax=Streptomyces sp. NBC_01565 TaxID=2975881 RepID=UPI00224E6564|nr:hypothetical protein [Streptomyces sp. NBC_01565]MCX4543756.1 hypothetical protein [Streptomyces sp. NBC_01565]
MTKKEYDEQQRRLADDIENARQALARARHRFDDLCRESQNLRLAWQEQQATA